MDSVTRTFLRAAMRLDESAETFDRALEEVQATQTKHDAALKKLLDLVKTHETKWDPKDRAAMNSLGARLSVHRRALDKQLAQLGQERKGYAREKAVFAEMSDLYASRLAAQSTTDDIRQTREAGLCRVVNRLIYDGWPMRANGAVPDAGFETPKGSHGYITLDLPRFLNFMVELDRLLAADPDFDVPDERYRPVRYLEIGSGPGRNLIIARESRIVNFESVSGFDINPDLIERGHRLGLETELFVGDALEQDYGGYDVVYSFRPFSDMELQERLESRMVETMDQGAYIIAPLPYDLDLYPQTRRVSDTAEIWKKVA